MVALRATAVIRSVDGERETPVEEMFDSREKWLKPDELLVKVRFRDPGRNQCLTSAKLGLRKLQKTTWAKRLDCQAKCNR